MAVNKVVLSCAVALVAFLGHTSCGLYSDHRVQSRTSFSNGIQSSNDNHRASGIEENPLDSLNPNLLGDSTSLSTHPDQGGLVKGTERAGSQEATGLLPQSSSSSLRSPSLAPARQSSPREDVNPRQSLMSLAQIAESRRRARARSLHRQRQLRTQNFRRTILSGLGLEGMHEPNTSLDSETRRMIFTLLLQRHRAENVQAAQRLHEEERRCYLSQCSVPAGMNTSLWLDPTHHALRLNFPLHLLNRKRGEDEDIESAQLNLFVRPRDGCPCLDEFGEQLPGYIVSVHQFTKRLVVRKGKVVLRTILLDSRRIPLSGNVWLRLDVQRAVKLWMSRPRKNRGLEIRVAHVNGTSVDTRSVLALPDCFASRTERSCRHDTPDGGPTVERMSWPRTWHERQTQLHQGQPYLDLRTVDRSQTTVDLKQIFGSAPRRLGTLEDLLGSQ